LGHLDLVNADRGAASLEKAPSNRVALWGVGRAGRSHPSRLPQASA
jgi:hypothetical protein